MSDKPKPSDLEPGKDKNGARSADHQPTDSDKDPNPKGHEDDDGESDDGEENPQPFDTSLLDKGDKSEKDRDEIPDKSPTQKPTRENQAEKQIEAWYKRVASGEVELDDDRIPKWVKPGVEKRLQKDISSLDEDEPSGRSGDDIKKSVLEESRFERLIESIPSLTPTAQKQLVTEARRFESLGMKKFHAWKEAIDRMKVRQDAEKRGAKAALMGAPGSSGISEERKKKGVSDSAKALGKKMGLSDSDYKKYGSK